MVAVAFICAAYIPRNEEHKVLYLSTLIVSAIIGVVLLGTLTFFIVKQNTQTNEVNTYNMNEFSKYSMVISKDKDAKDCSYSVGGVKCKSDEVKDAISDPQQQTTLEFPAVKEKTGASVNARIVIGNDYKLRLFTQQGSNDSTWKIVEPSGR
jgi:hypothetical protein